MSLQKNGSSPWNLIHTPSFKALIIVCKLTPNSSSIFSNTYNGSFISYEYFLIVEGYKVLFKYFDAAVA